MAFAEIFKIILLLEFSLSLTVFCEIYSSFLLHTRRAAEKFGLNPRDILIELGRRRMVGGQEDMIVDVAYQLAQQKNK